MREQKLSAQACSKIRELIKNRRYLPGEPLPENELSLVLGMSRTPIREALHRLEDEQVVTVKPHLGAFVATADLGQLCDIYETREAVDGMIGRLLCKSHIDTAPVAALKEKLLRIKEIPGAEERTTLLHAFGAEYAALLGSLCGNLMLEKLSASIRSRTDSMGLVTRTIPLFPYESVPERLEVLEAVIAKDADRAEGAARRHVRNAFSRIMTTIMPSSREGNGLRR
jgi:DNA-binding GntR family transcriptional regulator